MKSSTYYFRMKKKILADFQTCISVPLRKEKDSSQTVKTSTHVASSFVLNVYYTGDVSTKNNEHFCNREKECLNVFAKNMEKFLGNFTNFPKEEIFFKERKIGNIGLKQLVIYVKMNLLLNIKIITIIITTQGKMEELHIQYGPCIINIL